MKKSYKPNRNRRLKEIFVTKIEFGETFTKNISAYESRSITPLIYPSNATNKKLIWISDNTNVAIIRSNGELLTRSKGSAIITAIAADGSNVSNSFKITVNPFKPQCYYPGEIKKPIVAPIIPASKIQILCKVEIFSEVVALPVGTKYTLRAKIEPDSATNRNISWSISNSIATLTSDGDLYTLYKPGKAEITASIQEYPESYSGAKIFMDTCKIEVFDFKTTFNDVLIGKDTSIPSSIWRTPNGVFFNDDSKRQQAKVDVDVVIKNINSKYGNTSKKQKVINMYTIARVFQSQSTVPANLTTVQWILESDFGKNIPYDYLSNESSNNVFGIKAVDKQRCVVTTDGVVYKEFNEVINSLHAFYDLLKPKNILDFKDEMVTATWIQRLIDLNLCDSNSEKIINKIITDWGLI
jgi:flagellum-specific peptidoglycan hydrolase FlgJ